VTLLIVVALAGLPRGSPLPLSLLGLQKASLQFTFGIPAATEVAGKRACRCALHFHKRPKASPTTRPPPTPVPADMYVRPAFACSPPVPDGAGCGHCGVQGSGCSGDGAEVGGCAEGGSRGSEACCCGVRRQRPQAQDRWCWRWWWWWWERQQGRPTSAHVQPRKEGVGTWQGPKVVFVTVCSVLE
jgi:hypothetical protein